MTSAEQHALPTGYLLLGDYEILGATSMGVASVKYAAAAGEQRVVVEEYFPPRLAVRRATGEVAADPRSAEEFEAGLAAFLATARLLAGVEHESVVAVQRWTDANGTGYVVTPHVEGETLGSRLADDGTLPPDEVEAVFGALIDGLEIAHAAGLLHRQINPDAIVLRPDAVPVLRDFGVGAKVARSARQVFRRRHRSLANIIPGYAALEQYSDLGQEGPWTDVYGLGAVMHRCVSGTAPDDAPARLVRGDTPSAAGSGAATADRTRAAIDQALALRIAARPPSLPAWRGMLFDTAYQTSSAARAGRTSARGFGHGSSRVAARTPRTDPVGRRATRAPADPAQARHGLRWAVPAVAATALTAFLTYVDTGVLRGHDAADAAPAVARRGDDRQAEFADGMRSGGTGPGMRIVDQGTGRAVAIERPFALSIREITFEEYDRYAAAVARPAVLPPGWTTAHPVVNVSWNDAAGYARWLSAETGQAYRLPTETEWEYAARADEPLPYLAPSTTPAPALAAEPAGAGASNPWGFQDMEGNVSEWVADCVAAGAPGPDAADGSTCLRVRRGNSWVDASNAGIAARGVSPATRRTPDTGFRVAREGM